MSKITLNSVADLSSSSTAQTTINGNFTTLQTAFDNTLSRDGSQPNQMAAAIDMNSNQIFNLPAPSTMNSPARLVDVASNPTITVPGTGTSGHTVPFLDGNNTFSGINTFTTGSVLGTPTSVTLTNATGLPVATGISGLGTGVATFLATPSSTNLAACVTGETGSGGLVFATSPTITSAILVTPALGTPASGVITNCTGSPTLTAPVIGAATGTSLSMTSGLTVYNATAIPAGGTSGTGIKMSTTANLGVFFGSGVPTLSAAQGSLYIRTDGSSTSTRMYINTNGATTWTNVTTAA